MSATPKSSWPWVKTLLYSVYDQPDRDGLHDQYNRILDALSEKLPAVAEHLDTARADVLAFSTFPKEIWRQILEQQPQRAPRHPHELRHSAASLLSAAGVPLEEVADVLGHAGTRVTSAVYRHRTTPTVEAAAGPMQHMFGSPRHGSTARATDVPTSRNARLPR